MASIFTWQEVEGAIQAPDQPLCASGYGTVYRGRLQGVSVAIKVLNPDSQQGQAEFHREVGILGRLHHEHLLPLLGSCPEKLAVVYPLMEGGSLEQRLAAGQSPGSSSSSSTKALTWRDRVLIFHEVVLGLMWLHGQQPEPVLHMNLRSATILLDRSGAVKLSDVGLASGQQTSGAADLSVQHINNIMLKGSMAYMAPEYLKRKMSGPYTDVYAIGVLMCELLTGKPPKAAVDAMEKSFKNIGTTSNAHVAAALQPLLDPAAEWPVDVAAKLAVIAAACLRPLRCRSSLQDMEPALQAMAAEAAAAATATAQPQSPAGQQQQQQQAPGTKPASDWIYLHSSIMDAATCPICSDLYSDPVFSPACLSYCHSCISSWLEEDGHSTCPVSKQPLQQQQLVPDYILKCLIEKMKDLAVNQQQEQQQPAAENQLASAWRDLHPSIMAAANCSICMHTYTDPVSTPDGASYCRRCIITWFHASSQGQPSCPVSRQPLQLHQLKPNRTLQGLLEKMQKIAVMLHEQQPLLRQQHQQQRPGAQLVEPHATGSSSLAEPAAPAPTAHPGQSSSTPVTRWTPPSDWQRLLHTALSRPDDAAVWQHLRASFEGRTHIAISGTDAFGLSKASKIQVCRMFNQLAPSWSSVLSLELIKVQLGEKDAIALAQQAHHWPQLQALNLACNSCGVCGVTAQAQQAARHWPQLQILDLEDNHIGDTGVTTLVQQAAYCWPQLQTLNLSLNHIGDDGVAALSQHAACHWPQLQSLNMGSNDIGVVGATTLAQHAAYHWPRLKILDLSCNMIGAAGATTLAQHAAHHWPQLLTLNLRLNQIGADGVTALAQQAAHHWQELQSLNLRGNNIGNVGVTALAQHGACHWAQLQSLNLGANYIGTAGVTALAQQAAHRWPHLHSLNLGANYIGAAGVTALVQQAASHWPQLQTLELEYNEIGAVGVTALAQHAACHWPQLQTLNLGLNNIGDVGVTALVKHTAYHWPQLQTLILYENNIGAAGVTALAQQAARQWPQLQTLDLGGNQIGADGVTALAQHAAQHWPHLQNLNLRGNNIGNVGVIALACRAAAYWPQLQTLNLRGNDIGAEGLTALAHSAVDNWPQLRCLNIHSGTYRGSHAWHCLKQKQAERMEQHGRSFEIV